MKTVCPYCGKVNDTHGMLTGAATPSPGDVSICWRCKTPSMFTEDGVRMPTAEEQRDLDANQTLQMLILTARLAATPAEVIRSRKNS